MRPINPVTRKAADNINCDHIKPLPDMLSLKFEKEYCMQYLTHQYQSFFPKRMNKHLTHPHKLCFSESSNKNSVSMPNQFLPKSMIKYYVFNT